MFWRRITNTPKYSFKEMHAFKAPFMRGDDARTMVNHLLHKTLFRDTYINIFHFTAPNYGGASLWRVKIMRHIPHGHKLGLA